jgi:hypothetical protein
MACDPLQLPRPLGRARIFSTDAPSTMSPAPPWFLTINPSNICAALWLEEAHDRRRTSDAGSTGCRAAR